MWMLALAALMAARPQPFQIARGGQARCAIVAPERLMNEARELAGWLGRITGAEIPVSPGTRLPTGPAIILGTARDFPAQARALGLRGSNPELVAIRSTPTRLWILALGDAGVAPAIYTLLHHIGCRWYFPHPAWHIIPRLPDLSVRISLRTAPDFDQREIWYEWGGSVPKPSREQFRQWLRCNRQGGHFQFHCGHNWAGLVPRSLFKQHPEYFALVKGKRQPSQLCVSNPEVVRIAAEAVIRRFRQHPELNMVSVEPNDGGGYCQCENCRRLGTISDQVFWFANQIIARVRREFSDKWVGLYAYAYHSDPPHFRIRPGVYVQVTTGFRYTKLSFDEQVRAFRRLGAKVGVYDYFSVYPWDFDIPGRAKASRVTILSQSIRHYRDLGLTTYSAESSCNWGPCGLGYWVAARLMWDADEDLDALLDDFFTRAFGKAAAPMRRLYGRWIRGERFSPRNLKLALQDLAEAYRLETDPAVQARLGQIAMYLHYLKLWRDYEVAARRTEGGRLTVPEEELLRRAEAWVRWCRRLTNTGLIAVHPTLFTSWFRRRMGSVMRIEAAAERAEQWKKAPTDEPSAEEARRLVEADLNDLAGLEAVEILGREFSTDLQPLARINRDALAGAKAAKPYPLFVETGSHYFIARAGERFQIKLTPLPGHSVQGKWRVIRVRDGREVAAGEVKAEKGRAATISFRVRSAGLYRLDPPTGYWHVARLEFGHRPLVVEASRQRPMRLWTPRETDFLWFWVPPGTRTFVIGLISGGWPDIRLRIRDGSGRIVFSSNRLRAGDQVSIRVPPGQDGRVWSLGINGLRVALEIYDIPPYLARQPDELLVPRETARK